MRFCATNEAIKKHVNNFYFDVTQKKKKKKKGYFILQFCCWTKIDEWTDFPLVLICLQNVSLMKSFKFR